MTNKENPLDVEHKENQEEMIEATPTGKNEPEMTLEEAYQEVDQDHIQKLESELTLEKEKLIRLFAEFENYKKRTIRERMDLMKTASQDVIISLLPVLDDFDRAVKNMESADNTLREGLLLIHQKLKTILEQKGLVPMNVTGNPFDTDLHEAITNVPAPDKMKGKVIDEAEKGYFLNGKVIRHAKVVVGN